jgi:hypothetical protein
VRQRAAEAAYNASKAASAQASAAALQEKAVKQEIQAEATRQNWYGYGSIGLGLLCVYLLFKKKKKKKKGGKK